MPPGSHLYRKRKKLTDKFWQRIGQDSAEKKQAKIKELWAITTFFNPSHFKTKCQNYQRFRKETKNQGLQLIAVELSYDNSFELKEGDADILIQITSKAILWQKERLLNLALDKLPEDCTKVCWIDADLVFKNQDWIYQTSKLLDHYKIVQPFHRSFRLPQGAVNHQNLKKFEAGSKNVVSVVYDYKLHGKYDRSKQCGYVWAIQREIVDQIKFYDRNIIGGGDRIMCRAIFYQGLPSKKKYHQPKSPYTRSHAKDIERYMKKFHQLVQGRVSYVPGFVFHLWHGNYGNRKYATRHFVLKRHKYHPLKDIKLDPQGCWSWDTDKIQLIRGIRKYFEDRKEDG